MKTPESSSGLRMARFWNTNASINIPAPATAHAISEPRIPVATPNRAGSENTPAPTMLPTTMAVSVGTDIFATMPGADSAAWTAGTALVGVLGVVIVPTTVGSGLAGLLHPNGVVGFGQHCSNTCATIDP